MKIEVTQELIDAGTRDCKWCPIELAVLPHLSPQIRTMVTGSGYMFIGYAGQYNEKVQLPLEAIQFVAMFDRHEKVRPFAFDLDLPAEYVRSSEL